MKFVGKKNRRLLLLPVVAVLQLTILYACSDNDAGVGSATYASHVSIIPQPVSVVYGSSDIILPENVSISNSIAEIPSSLLKETLEEMLGSSGKISTVENGQAFIQAIEDNTITPEGYKLSINEEGIYLSYATSQGLLWGVQTLRQIILQGMKTTAGVNIPQLTILDNPKTEWRGFHIDVARHMFSMEFLKKLVDQLSLYKINRLQMHLTDDQGWRIEIKKYPALTTVGGWRHFDKYDMECLKKAKTDPSFAIDERFVRNGDEYGGYYTQNQLKDFIKYATERGLDVIPEIDMPGHFSSAIKAFPQLSCTGGTGWGEEFSNPICAGKTQNYDMLKDIISEVADLFPSEYFHLGADEVEKTAWKACKDCKELIQTQNLGDMDGLQNYFVHEMAEFVRSKGKKPMAWDDAFHAENPQQLLYTFWRDWKADQVGEMTQRGLSVVFMEWGHFYLSADPSDELLKELYNFDFLPNFRGVVRQNIKGYQTCVWTETIPNETKMGEHLFPSLQAFSELSWSQVADWSSFVNRLPVHLKHLENVGLSYRTPDFLSK
ncbi:beta-N-acetylhexosaminidase [Prevotella sp. KH2C16]|uniref:beta-N-acetylhexosaminidase n=1 Tax=Prevotella sp. KH2C16 TaxID=1855325 RepID=UPI0008EC145D|nr:beta-N-acetylhexosaminidase [Prevotella sp. KH2C16]SFG16146.1 hexosaminidase [Prevotella sp. KH2C16]